MQGAWGFFVLRRYYRDIGPGHSRFLLRLFAAPAIAYLLLATVLSLLFWAALQGQERLAFRDTSHFYTPLYEYVAARQQVDWVPLWNALDLTGLPLAGETTTAVFYPPRIIVYSIVSPATAAITWYVVLHLFLAGITAHVAARIAGANALGCAMVIVGYPLAGPVFFNIHNVPFLVGAAWLPLGIAGTVRLIPKTAADSAGQSLWIAMTALALAMPTLGGDPQTTVHVLMIALPLALWRTVQLYRQQRTLNTLLQTTGGLALAMLLSATIAAPQLAASLDWARQSQRLSEKAISERYDFSVPPWHWIEWLIPAASGQLFPFYTRISHLFPLDGRTWVTTLYAGIVGLLFVIHRYCRKHRRRFDIWDALLPVGLLFAIAGPYWLLGTTVPGYCSFRYPGKWLPLASLGFTIVAARETGSIFRSDLRLIRAICVYCSAITILIAGLAVLVGSIDGLTSQMDSSWLNDAYWGPLDVSIGLDQAIWSALTVTALLSLLWCLFTAIGIRRSTVRDDGESNVKARQRRVILVLLCLVAGDMYLAARPQMATIKIVDEDRMITSTKKALRRSDASSTFSPRSMRFSNGEPWPTAWATTADPQQRLLAVAASERATRFGRWHLSRSEAIFNTAPTLRPQRVEAFWSAMDQLHLRSIHSSTMSDWRRLEAWLGISRRLFVEAQKATQEGPAMSQLKVQQHPAAVSLVQWSEAWKTIPRQSHVSVGDFAARLAEVIDDKPLSKPVVEVDTIGLVPETGESLVATQINVISVKPEEVRLKLTTDHEGLVTLKFFQDGNWRATLQSAAPGDSRPRPLEVFPVDYLFMGAVVPAGDAVLTFVYHPWWLSGSVAVSILSWLLILLLGIRPLIKRVRL